MEKKMTAVRWLKSKIRMRQMTIDQFDLLFEQALALEREQHKQTWDKGVEWGDANCTFEGETRLPKFEDYYTKTYSEPLKDKI